MILAIDMGNSNIVIGGLENNQILFAERVTTNQGKTDLEYAITIKNIMEIYHIPLSHMEGSIISSVVPPLTDTLISAVKKLTKKEPLLVGCGMKTGLNILMDNPKTVGSDLIVNAVAALNQYPCPCIIIDMGTATTMSALNQSGSYIGGIIYPGLRVSLDSLSSKTAQLPYIGFSHPSQVIGKNTVDCMESGILFGNASMIDGMIERMMKELGESVCVIATGGLAPLVTPLCKYPIIYDDNLLLKGLAILYEKNK